MQTKSLDHESDPLWPAFLAFKRTNSSAPPDPASSPGDWLEWQNFKGGAAAQCERFNVGQTDHPYDVIRRAAEHLSRTERGQQLLPHLHAVLRHAGYLDSANVAALRGLVLRALDGYAGTVPDAIYEALPQSTRAMTDTDILNWIELNRHTAFDAKDSEIHGQHWRKRFGSKGADNRFPTFRAAVIATAKARKG